MKATKTLPWVALLLTACSPEEMAPLGDPIRVNQVGYYAKESKTAVIEPEGWCDNYRLQDATTSEVVWEGPASRTSTTPWNEKQHQIVDFSAVTKPGKYTLWAGKCSKEVSIEDRPYHDLTAAAIKAFYYQRSGTELLAEHAGKWARPAGHPDTNVLVHASAATKQRPEGTVISSPEGWYDAGDYNKYIVNSGFTIGEILIVYQFCSTYFDNLKLNIPESNNQTPDLLDEMMVNLRWMLTMQDPNDGGVYHKLTTPNFEDFQMPDQCQQPRYVVQKSTAATLDFAATMALAARIYENREEYKDFSKKAIAAAQEAWKWARKHPKTTYRQSDLNAKFDPDVNTGEYGDWFLRDEFFWAATELYFTIGKRNYLNEAASYSSKIYTRPVWGQVDGLAAMEWMIQTSFGYSPEAERFGNRYANKVTEYCDSLLLTLPTSVYDAPYGNHPRDFGWGCLAENCCGNGLSLLFAYRMTSDRKYLEAAIKCADYLLGRNATNYCFVTGFGQKPAMHPHHRVSASDNIDDPVPGLLVGGPNPAQQDHAEGYPSNEPDESYADVTDSYASNEIAINWNAGLVAFIGWLDAEVMK